VVLGEDHLRRILAEYFTYYNRARAHLSLDRNSPVLRRVFRAQEGDVVAQPYLGRLHHCYTRGA